METYKRIYDYDYEISNYGNIRSINKTIIRKNGRILTVIGRLLKKKIDKCGYIRYTLCKNGKNRLFLAHRLVAEYFIENKNNELYVNHKDENKSNNYYLNLEWCSCKYNNNYGTRGDRISKALIKEVVQYDKNLIPLKEYKSINIASAKVNLSVSIISMCCNKKRYLGGGFIWAFKGNIPHAIPKRKGKKSINQYTLNGEYIKTWDSSMDIQRNLGFGNSNILKCCKGKFHRWRYGVGLPCILFHFTTTVTGKLHYNAGYALYFCKFVNN